jgi:hypothetical protein
MATGSSTDCITHFNMQIFVRSLLVCELWHSAYGLVVTCAHMHNKAGITRVKSYKVQCSSGTVQSTHAKEALQAYYIPRHM